ncbi:ABC-F family ATP-binding cassette domain-containing protein [Pseudoroseicyclus tamaricis]|uniref:ABC-F family ATP-binding cassette domain-containing protein n=1 Tax=Pseudoroseicyclus tamaricis TaxID=2705421 RepID=A0A6B2JUE2_9RHOB|nr:ABC-F family ATP-binding cassette domain-containing protein [Pseudoroseicyclus tamaricis]NDV01545.1 ABC-F family ATP-binding cassette domain-containing protein [Pseudoroseicyclus tamaricis]
MARAPLLQLTDVSLTFGGEPIFDGLSAVVQEGDRVALVGRNGSGKSTLMKLMAGRIEPDRGARSLGPGTSVAYLEQDPQMEGFATLGDFAASDVEEAERYKVEQVAEGLDFDLDRPVSAASGGERRRAALAKLLASEPELMLLDEPTNHLDINAIRWLEDELKATRAAFVLISHDRAFLTALTRATLWLDRGVLRRQEAGFGGFEAWREKAWEEEDLARHKLDRKIKEEARWAVEGISARRKRNMGRVRALGDLRAERAGMIRRQGTAAMELSEGRTSGKKVIEAKGLAKAYGGRQLFQGLDLTLQRGDCLAVVGPNGAGKTTLLKVLLGEEAPDEGSIRYGTNLEMAHFDQARAALKPEETLWDAMTTGESRVSGRSDQVMVRGQPRHVVSYLKDFLFDEAQARAPVGSLSGGEKARLLLARIMARESNVLVLDEPTNDLDIETLDLLQEVLGDYPGTVILVSHDRDFIDRVASMTLTLEGGKATLYAGGWSDIAAQGGAPMAGGAGDAKAAGPTGNKGAKAAAAAAAPAEKKNGLSFTEKHRLEALPAEIDRLTAEIAKLEALMADPELFSREPVKFRKATEALTARQEALASAEEEWLELAEKAEG